MPLTSRDNKKLKVCRDQLEMLQVVKRSQEICFKKKKKKRSQETHSHIPLPFPLIAAAIVRRQTRRLCSTPPPLRPFLPSYSSASPASCSRALPSLGRINLFSGRLDVTVPPPKSAALFSGICGAFSPFRLLLFGPFYQIRLSSCYSVLFLFFTRFDYLLLCSGCGRSRQILQ